MRNFMHLLRTRCASHVTLIREKQCAPPSYVNYNVNVQWCAGDCQCSIRILSMLMLSFSYGHLCVCHFCWLCIFACLSVVFYNLHSTTSAIDTCTHSLMPLIYFLLFQFISICYYFASNSILIFVQLCLVIFHCRGILCPFYLQLFHQVVP